MKKRALIIASGLFIIFCLIWAYFYVSINRKYPDANNEQVAVHEIMNIDNVEYEVTDSNIYSYDELKEKYSDRIKQDSYESIEDSNWGFVFVNLRIKNNGKEEKIVNIYEFVVATKTTSNGLDVELFLEFNDEKLMNPSIKSGEEIQIILPYSFVTGYITGKINKNERISNQRFELIMSLYPERKSIRLY